MNRLSWRERLRRINQRSLFATVGGASARSDPRTEAEVEADAVSTVDEARAEAVQRLQVGLAGIGAMVLLVGLASAIGGQANRNDQLAVPEAAPTTEPSDAPAQANPLADAGVVPDIQAEPGPTPAPSSSGAAGEGDDAPVL